MIADLRSDTVTKPTPAMRQAMATAEVGDDVWGDDPTVNRLEELAADISGKEAALYVPSGTMGNLVATLAHTQLGQEIVLGDNSHIFYYEVAGATVVGALAYHTVPNDTYGMLDPQQVDHAIRDDNIHYPVTGLLCLENTHNRCGGTVLTKAQMDSLCAVAHARNVPVHLDGARLFNAAVYLETSIKDLVANIDSVQMCLSKGLAAPVGSLVVGKQDFIDRARKYRKMLGGGMRQAGIIAAAGIIALTEMPERLYDDHHNARKFAESLALVDGFEVDLSTVQTNIVIANLSEKTWNATEWLSHLQKEGVLATSFGARRLRFTFHNDVSRPEIEFALNVIARLSR